MSQTRSWRGVLGFSFCILSISKSLAAPSLQVAFRTPSSSSASSTSGGHEDLLGPLEYMSGIAPYHDAPGANIEPPAGCAITAATFLFRHSSITANDDEWDDYMKPFVERLRSHVKAANGSAFSSDSPLSFLNHWQSPINDDNLEALTKPGAKDAKQLGNRMRKLYPHLFPPRYLGKGKQERNAIVNAKQPRVRVPFKIWTASSSRDIGTAQAFVTGAFPHHQEGDGGEGDGKFVSLVKVDNKNPDWGASLTPHKICKAFSKEPGKPDARNWLKVYGSAPLARLRSQAPDFDFVLDDIVAMQMLCGYESVIKGIDKSDFCKESLFTLDEFKSFGYFHDLIYHRSVGYASPTAPFLGVPWLNTSVHNLLSINDDSHGFKSTPLPPNGTHTQRLFLYFTHREEPPVILVSLGLWNGTKAGPLPTDRRPDDRVWQTSHVLPFLGHVAIERMACPTARLYSTKNSTLVDRLRRRRDDYVRVIVNGAVQPLPDCRDGPGQSCPLQTFVNYVKERSELYSDFEGACAVKK